MGRTRLGSIRIVLLALVVLAMPVAMFSQGFQTGTVTGTVTDQSGGVLPGVTVTLTNQDRGTVRTDTTDAAGKYQFVAVPLQGRYSVEANLSGFQPVQLKDNKVEADKNTELNVQLKLSSSSEVITVTGQQPVVDRTNVAANTHLSNKEYEKAPVGRSYQSLMTLSPGVVDPTGGGNPQSHGATSTNNVYLFDGVDTTDTVTGTFGSNLNFEAVQEVSVQTSGESAEYGRASGAILNVVTKSGTNQFEGSAKSIQTNDKWNAQNKTINQQNGASLARTRLNHNNYRYSYTLGGPFWKDHVWFFGAIETAKTVTSAASLPDGDNYVQNRNLKLPNYRITAQVTPSQSIWAKYSADPFTGIVRDYFGSAFEAFALTAQGQGGNNKSAQYSGVFGSNITADLMYAQSTSTITVSPYKISPLNSGAPHYNLADNHYYNGATFDGFVARPRKQALAGVSYYATLGGNSHNFKVGIDSQETKSSNLFKYPNSQLFIDESFNPMTRAFVPFQRQDYLDGPSTSKGNINALYARDKFDISRRLFMELGVRFEKEVGKNDLGDKVVDTNDVAPRLQVSYDLLGDGRNILGGTVGRFYDSITQNFADAFAGVPQQSNYDEYTYNNTTKTYVKTAEIRQGGNSLPKNLGLKAPHMDEVTVSYQRQLTATTGAGVRVIHRKWNDLIDDVLTYDASDTKHINYINNPNARRKYDGVELTFDKRFAQSWNLLANYTYSKTRGNHFNQIASGVSNYVGQTCVNSTDKSAPFSATGTIPCSAAEASLYGAPGYDLPHVVNVIGTYTHTLGHVNLTAGTVAGYSSGVPYQKTRTLTVLKPSGKAGETVSFFYTGRGADRLPGTYNIGASLEATVKFFGVEVGAKGEAFNITDSQKPLAVNNVTYCNDASATASTSCKTARTNYGQTTTRANYQAPRGFRLTGLVRF